MAALVLLPLLLLLPPLLLQMLANEVEGCSADRLHGTSNAK
jgi:hypothetical protein